MNIKCLVVQYPWPNGQVGYLARFIDPMLPQEYQDLCFKTMGNLHDYLATFPVEYFGGNGNA